MFHEMDPRELGVKPMDVDMVDISDSIQLHELTDLQSEDITEQYRRYLADEKSGNATDCLKTAAGPNSFFVTLDGFNSQLALDEEGNAWVVGAYSGSSVDTFSCKSFSYRSVAL